MTRWNEGQKNRGFCQSCRSQQWGAYVRHSLLVSNVVVPSVLVLECEECGEVMAVPAQSMPEIRRALHEAAVALRREA